MIRKVKYLILLIFAVMLTTSCNKWLDLKPQDGIIRQNFWKTKEDVKAGVIGCYSSLLGSTASTLFQWGELRGDMVASTIKASADQQNIINDNITSANSICSWSVIYQTINYCNTVIAYAPNVLASDPTFTQIALNNYLAEAYGLRALMYFDLMRTFGDVPLKLEPTSSDTQLQQLAKSPQADVIKQIESDLTFAATNAVLTYGDQNQDKGRITQYTINAIQADVYLWAEDYPNAIIACDKVINSGNFGLIQGINDDGSYNSQFFNSLYYNGNSTESIFEFQFDAQKQNPFYNFFINTSLQFNASPLVMDQFYTVDPIDPLNRDVRADMCNLRASDGVIWKYAGASGSDATKLRSSTASYAHWFVYRYADILLMKAEALAWTTGKGQDALDLINVIRKRANALVGTEMSPSITDSQAISDYIMDERAREFAFEGKRWYDILRNSKRNNYANLQYMLNIEVNIALPAIQQSVLSKYKDIRSHYLPINLYDMQTDPNLVQNPFYQ